MGPLFEGAHWWDPDERAAADAVREALRGNHASGVAPARIADLTWEHATTRLLEILEELHRQHGLPFPTGGG